MKSEAANPRVPIAERLTYMMGIRNNEAVRVPLEEAKLMGIGFGD